MIREKGIRIFRGIQKKNENKTDETQLVTGER